MFLSATSFGCEVSSVLFLLYQSGCEFWQLSHNKLADFSTTWRKSVRKVWQLPTRVHCHILPLLCRCLYQSKTKSVSDLLNSYANASIAMMMSYDQWLTTLLHNGRNNSPLGRNAMFCMDRYNRTLGDILYSTKIEDMIHFFCLGVFLRLYA